MSMKNPMTPAGIEPATFRFVAQHLNHCATAVKKNTLPPHYKHQMVDIFHGNNHLNHSNTF